MTWVFKHLMEIKNSFELYYFIKFKKSALFDFNSSLPKVIIFSGLFKDKVT